MVSDVRPDLKKFPRKVTETNLQVAMDKKLEVEMLGVFGLLRFFFVVEPRWEA